MARKNKKQFANYLLLFFGLYSNLYPTIEHDTDPLNEYETISQPENSILQDSITEASEIKDADTLSKTVKNLVPEEEQQFSHEDFEIDHDISETNDTSDTNISNEKQTEPANFINDIDQQKRQSLHEEKRKIKEIYIIGNNIITAKSIMNKLPLKVGDTFSVNYTATIIKNLYSFGYFQQVKVYAQPLDENEIELLIMVEEKPRLKEVTFSGNKAVSEKDLKEELKISSIPTLVKEELTALVSKIKKMYVKKNHHHVEVDASIIPESDGQVSAEFKIKEGKKSYINQIQFKGNHKVSSKKLKKMIFSKEDWILGTIFQAGSYNPEMIEGDKAMIEDAYKSNGFIHAKVTNVDVEQDKASGNYHLTYTIHEGERYKIKSISVPGNDILSEDQLKMVIPLFPGQIYSVEKVRNAIENLRLIWGEHGYIFADIDPEVDVNDEEKTISITFNSDLKDQIYLNRLTIKGNVKSKDKVIRRNILLDEGELITNQKMEASKSMVGLLNYFEQKDGVNWKTTRIDETHADLDMILKEVKTGHFHFNIGYGGSPTNKQSPQSGLNVNCNVGDRNLLGSGIAASAAAEIAKKYRSFDVSLVNPWLFDKPLRGSMNGFIKKSNYEDVSIAQRSPQEQVVGGALGVGYLSKRLNGVSMEGRIQYDRITYDNDITANQSQSGINREIASFILDRQFQAGSQISFIYNIHQDKRNGVVFPSNGHQWNWLTQFTVPGAREVCANDLAEGCTSRNNTRFNYLRTELDVSWYTPLIGEHDLVLCVHGNGGIIHRFEGKEVPWKNLYHVGGPTSIRGYTYGQVGPTWNNTSIGATKAFNVNVEFIAPVTSDLNTRAVIFYDGGAGWDTPYKDEICSRFSAFGRDLENNRFFYRHSVGIGIRIKSPSPLQVDFGIKLNPSKKFKNELTQLHLTMDHAF